MQVHFLVPISVILHTLSYRTLQKRSILKGMMIIRRWQIKCRTIWLSEGVTAAGHFIPLKNAINGEISQSGSKNNVADIIELLTTVSNTWNCTKRTKMFYNPDNLGTVVNSFLCNGKKIHYLESNGCDFIITA